MILMEAHRGLWESFAPSKAFGVGPTDLRISATDADVVSGAGEASGDAVASE